MVHVVQLRHAVQIGDSVSPSCSSVAGARTVVQELFTVLPAYLVPRHQLFPTLNTHLKVTPSYAEAPREGTITICYSYISSQQELEAWSVEGGRAVVRAATALVRDQLITFSGYEVREMSGNFLLAFRSPDDALRFCISTQHAFMQVLSPALRLCLLHPGAAGAHPCPQHRSPCQERRDSDRVHVRRGHVLGTVGVTTVTNTQSCVKLYSDCCPEDGIDLRGCTYYYCFH